MATSRRLSRHHDGFGRTRHPGRRSAFPGTRPSRISSKVDQIRVEVVGVRPVRASRSALAFPLAVVAAVVVVAALAGCVQHSAPASTPVIVPTATPSGTATASAIPTYDPTGTAEDNLAYFDKVGRALLTNNPTANSQGETIVNWFVAHGFNKANMEVTPDKTSIGLAAWNIEFSVKFGSTCLLGQAGNVGFQSTVLPVLATGKCLIGTTRPINF
jgi:hypothetical protein